jgi:hypothetical protein
VAAEEDEMADGPTPAVALMAKAEQDKRAAEKRIADARKAAAGELGEIVLKTGAHLLPPRELSALLTAMMTVGSAKALDLMTAAAAKPAAKPSPGNGQANGHADSRENGHVTA